MLKLRTTLVAALGLLALAACTPQEVALFSQVTEPTRGALSDAQLGALRSCEASGDYGAVSRSGTYRGAYQFSRATWDGVAARHFPWLVGVDPATAEFYWQDAMARALYSESGPDPWPICGRVL